MKLSLRGEYALRAMLVLGLNYEQPVVRIQTISDQQNIPKRFLEQILNDLKSAGFGAKQARRGGGVSIGEEAGANHPGRGCAARRGGAGPGQLCQREVLREMLVPGRVPVRHPERDERGARRHREYR